MASDLRPLLGPIFDAFGVPATVTRPAPDEEPIETTVVWVSAATDDVPSGAELGRKEPRKALSIRRADVPTLPRKTTIEAPESLGGDVKRWRVDSIERDDVDEIRALVIPEPEP